jgi:Tfp pilus assembly PilM family ATPase
MSKHDDISSTEKLLNLIRGKRDTTLETSVPFSSQGTVKKTAPVSAGLKKLFSFGKTITVGADIGTDEMRLVKISRSSDQKRELLDYLKVPFEPDPEKLKAALKTFCGPLKKSELWAAVSVPDFQARHLHVPKVSKSQLSNAVYWTYKKEISFNEKEHIFDFELLGTTVQDGTEKTEVMAYTVPRGDIEDIRSLFSKSGFPVKGVSVHPFAYQNLFKTRLINTNDKNVCSLYVGKSGSRIDIFLSNGNLALSRKIKASMSSMADALKEKINEGLITGHWTLITEPSLTVSRQLQRKPDSRTHHTSPSVQEIDTAQTEGIFFSLIRDESDRGAGFSKDEIFEMITPALKRLVRQVEITLDHYCTAFRGDGIGKIYLSGRISTYQPFVDYIAEHLKIPAETGDPFTSLNPLLAKTVPETVSERVDFALAAGMAVSDHALTPNFIFTYKEKEKIEKVRRINRVIYSCFFFAMLLCGGIYYWQDHLLSNKKAELKELHNQIEKYNPKIDKTLIVKKVSGIRSSRRTLKAYSRKYRVIALIREISDLTPSYIRLTGIAANMGRPSASQKQGKNSDGITTALNLKGIVLGDPLMLEKRLSDYLMDLEKSRMFERPVIENKSPGYLEDKKVLQFTANLELFGALN